VLDRASGAIKYANAGHNPGLVVRSDGATEELGSTGLPLGMISNADYALQETSLDSGDLLVLYSDGYTEAANSAAEEYGIERLAASCAETRSLELGEIANAIEGDVAAFTDGGAIGDDRTLVIVRRSND
jgi:sigma-B regulation protein RsbU (phosphoserine phosphatase)